MQGQFARHPRIAVTQTVCKSLEISIGDFATWKWCIMSPITTHFREDVLQPMHTALSQFAECSDFSAKYVQQWCVIGLIKIENIVARDGGWIAFAVIEQRTYAREAVQHIFATQFFLEIAVYCGEQIIDFFLIRAHIFRTTFIGNIGGSDQRLVAFIGVYEDHALVVVLHQIGIRTGPELWHDDMAPLNKTHIA